jgi:hypothetical protein
MFSNLSGLLSLVLGRLDCEAEAVDNKDEAGFTDELDVGNVRGM